MQTLAQAMELTLTVKNVYGNETIYPVCEKSKLLAKLAGTKTITKEALRIIQELGYTYLVKYETNTI